MANIARIERRVAGVLTNADTVTLGIVRIADSVVVLAPGAAATNPSTGIYEYDYSALSLDPSYTYRVTWTVTTGLIVETVTQVIASEPGSRAMIRRQIGRLLHPHLYDFMYTSLTSIVSTSLVLPQAFTVPDNSLIGKILYFITGDAVGQPRVITANTRSTGTVTVASAYSPAPDPGDVLEIWPESIDINTVNDHINLAIDRLSEIVGVYVEQEATLDALLQQVTLPSELTHVIGVRFQNGYGHWYDYMASADPWQDPYAGPSLSIRGGYAYLSNPIPESDAPVYVRGYRAPAYLHADTDVSEINPAYIVYMTAYMLDSGQAYGQVVDPEQHNTRATNWYNQAKDIEMRSATNWLPHTIPVNI
jgi:hypothetical protein